MNRTPRKLYLEDRRDRNSKILTPEKIMERDYKRRLEAMQWLKSAHAETQVSPLSLYYTALIFHHGTTKRDHVLAKRLALRSHEGGYKKAGWLYAAATDRLLILSGKLQKFGTQYFRKSVRSKWELYATDKAITDRVRSKYGILAKAQELSRKVRKLPRVPSND